MFGQFNIELRADNAKECSEDIIRRKLKVAGGADYDTGSNAAGYKSSGNIKAKALESYGQKVPASAERVTVSSDLYINRSARVTSPVLCT